MTRVSGMQCAPLRSTQSTLSLLGKNFLEVLTRAFLLYRGWILSCILLQNIYLYLYDHPIAKKRVIRDKHSFECFETASCTCLIALYQILVFLFDERHPVALLLAVPAHVSVSQFSILPVLWARRRKPAVPVSGTGRYCSPVQRARSIWAEAKKAHREQIGKRPRGTTQQPITTTKHSFDCCTSRKNSPPLSASTVPARTNRWHSFILLAFPWNTEASDKKPETNNDRMR